MAKRKRQRKWKMPQRLWNLDIKGLNYQQKHLLNFIWACSPRGCVQWNCRLAKKFKRNPRTIRRWISNLSRLGLIAIGHADGPGRTIWPKYQAYATKPKLDIPDRPKDPKQVARFLAHLERKRKAQAKLNKPPPKWNPAKVPSA